MIFNEAAAHAAFEELARLSLSKADARGNMIFTANNRRIVRAQLQTEAGINNISRSAEGREIYALTHSRYLEAVKAEASAAAEFDRCESEMERLKLIIDCWRTGEASNRGLARAHR
jgi:hypothetical protein